MVPFQVIIPPTFFEWVCGQSGIYLEEEDRFGMDRHTWRFRAAQKVGQLMITVLSSAPIDTVPKPIVDLVDSYMLTRKKWLGNDHMSSVDYQLRYTPPEE